MMEQLLQSLGGGQTFSHAILIWALMMARVMPLLLLAPFIGGDLVPAPVKLATGIALSMLLYPFLADTKVPASAIAFVLLMLKEVFIGMVLAFVASLAFDAVRAAGTFIDTVSGANQATVHVPQLGTQASLYADFKFQLTIVIFLGLNGHHLVLQSLFESFRVIPLSAWPKFGHGFWPFFELVMRTTAQFIIIALAMAAPAAIATFVTDLTLGLINRVAPQIQVFFISMAIKPMVATFMVLVCLNIFYEQLLKMFETMLVRVRDVVTMFS